MGERWELPGGKAEPTESPEEALRRELKEEFDLDVEVGELRATTDFVNKGETHTLLLFDVQLPHSPHRLYDHDEVRFFSPSEIGTLSVVDSDRRVLRTVLAEKTETGG